MPQTDQPSSAVTIGSTSTTIWTAQKLREPTLIYNASDETVYIEVGQAATTNSMTLSPGASIVLYTNLAVYGICSSGGKVVNTFQGVTAFSGGAGGSISVTTKEDEYLALLGSVDANASYRSPADFTAAYSSATELSLYDLPYDLEVEQVVGVVQWDSTSQISKVWLPSETAVTWAQTGSGQGTLTVSGATFAVGDVAYEVILHGPHRNSLDSAAELGVVYTSAEPSMIDLLQDIRTELRRLNTYQSEMSDTYVGSDDV